MRKGFYQTNGLEKAFIKETGLRKPFIKLNEDEQIEALSCDQQQNSLSVLLLEEKSSVLGPAQVYMSTPLDNKGYEVKPKFDLQKIVNDIIQKYPLCTVEENLYVYKDSPNKFMLLNKNKAQQLVDRYLRLIGEYAEPGEIDKIKKALLYDSRIALCKKNGLPPEIWAFRNCLVNVRTREVLHGHGGYFFTNCMACNYEPHAICPIFDSFLTSCTGNDPMLIELIWQVIGYICSNDSRAKVFFLFAGPKDTGKSVLADIITSLFEEGTVCAMGLRELDKRFALSELVGKKLGVCMDLGDKVLSEDAVGVVKAITGGDLVRAEVKYKSGEPVRIDAKLLFGTNHAIRIAGADPAFADRQIVVPFRYPVPKERQDRWLREKMQQEIAGIAVKAIEAYLHLVENNYIFYNDNVAVPVLESVDSKKIIQDFSEQMCDLSDESARISTDKLYQAYCHFVEDRRLPAVDKNKFSQIFHEQHPNHIKKRINFGKDDNRQGYEGVKLK